jgi:hypothetical protein
MPFLSYEELEQRRRTRTWSEKSLIENFAASNSRGSVFLSHSTKDNTIAGDVADFLKGFGAYVYIDDRDESLPNPPSPQTAKILKDAIKDSKRFILLATANSKDSRWIPWELGLADGYKTATFTAVLPVSHYASEERWAFEEYFALYPRIYKSDSGWFVKGPNGEVWTLESWLK